MKNSFSHRLLLVSALLAAPMIAAAAAAAAAAAEPAGAVAEPAAAADSPGQDDLDAAVDAKLSAQSIDDFANVLDLCKRAIKKGLATEQKQFAEDLYTDTLMYRAGRIVQAIYEVDTPDPQWPRLRSFAMRDLNEVVDRDPKLGDAQLMIAQLESLPGGNRERARTTAAKAIELLPDDRLQTAQAHIVLGNTADADDREERASHYDKAVELAPRDKDIRRTRGLFYLLTDELEKARGDLEAAIEADPEDASLQEALGLSLMMNNKLEAAQEAFDRAIKLDPDSSGALLQRARVRAMRGDRPEAIADLDKAIRIAPDEVVPLVLRARIHQQAGDSDRAAADLERVLAKHPDHPAAIELRGLIAAERVAALEGRTGHATIAASTQSLSVRSTAAQPAPAAQPNGASQSPSAESAARPPAHGIARFPVLRATLRFGKPVAILLAVVVFCLTAWLAAPALGGVAFVLALVLGGVTAGIALGYVELIRLITEFLMPE